MKAGAPGPQDGAGRFVADTSVVVDGRITRLIGEGEYEGARVLIPNAVMSELEALANRGKDAGYNGLTEVAKLRTLAAKGVITLEFVGERPGRGDVERADEGAVDALIRDTARDLGAVLVTGDKIQSQVCEAIGIPYRYLRAEAEAAGFEELAILRFFTPDMMSVHLKQDVEPHGKRGRPGHKEYIRIGERKLAKRELQEIAREIVETARRDDRSFVEVERQGATVVQLRDMRIAISRPPFSDAIEITAVRPVVHLSLGDYELPEPVKARLTDYTRGVFVSGPPGSGKSTFAQAIAEYLHGKGTVVKTMESPRDLQLPDAITQYAPLERDIELTGDFLLLVRPDFVVYDEVRKTRDFEVFADMRLAGVGLIGVTHANRAIDAVQRLIGRVELGMIPQVVDTVVHIVGGKIQQILEMDFTVRVPSGMTEADLARPVIRVRDFNTKQELFEIYTYGEQVVVMPMQGGRGEASGVQRLASRQLEEILARRIAGSFEVEMTGADRATVYVDEGEIASVIGRGGSRVQALERQTGLKLDIKTFRDRPAVPGGERRRREPVEAQWAEDGLQARGVDGLHPRVKAMKKSFVLAVDPEFGGREVEVRVDGLPVAHGHLSHKGEMKVDRKSREGKQILRAQQSGGEIVLVFP